MKLSHAVDLYIQRERDAGMRFDSPTNILRSFLRHCVEAIALLALDDRTQHPVVQTSVEWLEHATPALTAPWSLSWAILALAAHGRAVESLITSLWLFLISQAMTTPALWRLCVLLLTTAAPWLLLG
jgi:hypothetical protein